MVTPAQHPTSPPLQRQSPSQGGAALVVALLILLVLTVIGISTAGVTLLQERMAANTKQQTAALFAAESGIAEVLWWLERPNNPLTCETNMLSGTPGGRFTRFQVDCTEVLPGQLGGCGPGADACYRLLSTGDHLSADGEVQARRRVETLVGIAPGRDFGDVADAAVSCFGVSISCSVNAGGSPGSVDGRDYPVPADFECEGAGCRTSLDPDRNAEGTVDKTGARLWGDGELAGGSNQYAGNPASEMISEPFQAESAWNAWFDAWVEISDALGEPAVVTGAVNQTGELGTRTSPQFSRLASGSSVAGNLSGAGVLVVEAGVSFEGTMSYEGLVILMPGASLNTGNSTFYGAVIGLDGQVLDDPSGTGSTAITISGNGEIRFSSQALDNARRLLGPAGVEVLSWRHL
ncbi:pilus assembly PilX family protein [Alkalilimnicola ehrlichii MLHE-1]|uniref:Tfp pilus assembly protein PilX-like protein n=1 Tax=Alkalilimnicola ehrlichii (strain ATCC BAA-1101 / DSM 17681 / MLHE-1) TaxID=187272 RepID=Q0AAC3_ALKEH|nr:PilX N-terminal domain-containing pilus assembly protein [Alkalilimnicola ehrlichii]ABI56214.1 Tfp pilus assembly protein PilX-like protein [Alkalilimnicola ehrlichii MLHE-1]